MEKTLTTHLLQVVIAAVLLLLGIYLVPLLIQLRKTAQAMEDLARSASKDISRVADDVHQIKLQVDEISFLARETFAMPVSLGKTLKGLFQGIPAIFGSNSADLGSLGLFFGALRGVVSLFRRGKSRSA